MIDKVEYYGDMWSVKRISTNRNVLRVNGSTIGNIDTDHDSVKLEVSRSELVELAKGLKLISSCDDAINTIIANLWGCCEHQGWYQVKYGEGE